MAEVRPTGLVAHDADRAVGVDVVLTDARHQLEYYGRLLSARPLGFCQQVFLDAATMDQVVAEQTGEPVGWGRGLTPLVVDGNFVAGLQAQ